LWQEWDPIGVNDIQAASDEYDTYALQVSGMVAKGSSEREIAEYLTWVETERMGLSDSPAANRKSLMIAKKALALKAP